MKKVFLSAALALAVAGSWAFYPKAAEPGGYMMVVVRLTGSAFNAEGTMSVITPTGQVTEQALAVKSLSGKSAINIYTAELAKINQLKAEGWEVTQRTNSASPAVYENVYLLKKP